MKSFTGLLLSYTFGYLLSIKKIFHLKYKNIVFNYKSSVKCKCKILIASNTTSALHITNLELYFAKILYKNNYDEFIGLIYTKKGEELFNEYYESFLEFLYII